MLNPARQSTVAQPQPTLLGLANFALEAPLGNASQYTVSYHPLVLVRPRKSHHACCYRVRRERSASTQTAAQVFAFGMQSTSGLKGL